MAVTLCLSNVGQSAKPARRQAGMNKMSKIINSAIMNKSAENPATTHTRDRYTQFKKYFSKR